MKRLPALLLALLLLGGCAASFPEALLEAEPTLNPPSFQKPQAQQHAGADDGVFTLPYAPDYSLNPFTCRSETNQALCGLLFEPMLRLGPDFQAQPCILRSWTAEGGLLFRFSIAAERRFSDGSPLRDWDVLYSLNRAMEEGSVYAARLEDILSTELEAGELVIRLREPNPSFPLRLDIPVVREGSAYADLPVGSGAYVLGEGCLERNPNYPDALPLERIAVLDCERREQGILLANGTLDLLAGSAAASARGLNDEAERHMADTSLLYYLGVQPERPALADPARRRLVSAVLDRSRIAACLDGTASTLPLPAGLARAEWAAPWLPVDLKAYGIQILTEDYNGDGLLEYFREGEATTFSLRLIACADNRAGALAARQIESDLRLAGIRPELRLLDTEAFQKALQAGDYDLYLASVRLTADFDLSALLCGSGFHTRGSEGMRQTVSAFRAAEAEERTAAAKRLCEAVAEECPLLPLAFGRSLVLTRRGAIRGLSPTWTNPFHDLTSWSITETERDGEHDGSGTA